MFDLAYLHEVRARELAEISRHIPRGARVLEVGGGSGRQAAMLAASGVDVVSIDVPSSNYHDVMEFPVVQYDGRAFPFADDAFDVVFSSNVLEHILHVDVVHAEIRRVLRPAGRCVHVVPTAAWRFWTSVAHYAVAAGALGRWLGRLVPRRMSVRELRRAVGERTFLAPFLRSSAIPPRHGEAGTARDELRTFGTAAWREQFHRNRFAIVEDRPLGLLYTGHMLLGPRLPFPVRRRLASFGGSACHIFVLVPD